MNLTLRALAGLSVWSMAMAYGAGVHAQAPAPAAPAPYPGYPQPAPAYPQQQAAPGYQQPAPGYQQPAPGYQQPAPGYQQPAPGYPQQPVPGYQQPAPGYQQPAPGYAQPAAGYQPAPGYPPAAPPPGYGQPAPSYWQPAPGYGAPVAAAPAGPLQWYDTFYGHIGLMLGFHGWGGISVQSESGDISGKFKTGVLMSGYAPLSPTIHLGGYFSYGSGDYTIKANGGESPKYELEHYSVGFSLKAGSRLHERIWLGFVGDLGFYANSQDKRDTWYGVEVSPRLHVDVLGISTGGFRMGPFASIGPSIVPYATGTFGQGSGNPDGSAWLLYINVILGATFGT